MSPEIQQRWRRYLVRELRDSYGLRAQEAQTKVDLWLEWVMRRGEANARFQLTEPAPSPASAGRPRSANKLRRAALAGKSDG
jgi:hypothetical protein